MPKCLWERDGDGNWDTACGERFTFETGTPVENGFTHCPYCGKRLLECGSSPEMPTRERLRRALEILVNDISGVVDKRVKEFARDVLKAADDMGKPGATD